MEPARRLNEGTERGRVREDVCWGGGGPVIFCSFATVMFASAVGGFLPPHLASFMTFQKTFKVKICNRMGLTTLKLRFNAAGKPKDEPKAAIL